MGSHGQRDVQMAQIYGHQSVVHHDAGHRESSRRGSSRPTSANTYSKHNHSALFTPTPAEHKVQHSAHSAQPPPTHQSSKSHERDHVLTKGDTLRCHTPRTPMQRDSHRHSHRNTRSHQSSAIHTPDVHDHSAMELDGTLTSSPSRTGGTDHEASGNENVEPQIREREKALRDVSRVLSLTQHLPEQKAKRSTHVKEMDDERAGTNVRHAPVLSLTHNGPHSPPFEPALPLCNEDSNQTTLTNMTAGTLTSVDVVSVHGLLKMQPMVAQRTSAREHGSGHTPNVSMDSALSRITDVSTISVFAQPLGGGHRSMKNIHRNMVNTVNERQRMEEERKQRQKQRKKKKQKTQRAYHAVEHREESESRSESESESMSESEEESDERRRSGRRRGASLARQRAVTVSVKNTE